MKKIVNGLRYDTEIAEEVGGDCWHGPVNDFHYWEETLYRTPRGKRFFLHGEGGGLTAYATVSGHGRGYGERIIPMTDDEAYQWAEEHMYADDIINVFGDRVEDA